MGDPLQEARSVKSAERVLDLLEHIGGKSDGITFAMLSRHLNIPKSSLHALLGRARRCAATLNCRRRAGPTRSAFGCGRPVRLTSGTTA